MLHGRKYQLLLAFWVIIFLTIQGKFASHFGANTLFLAPEYLGRINFVSMALLGASMGIFIMAWHITTFIIHSKRMPFIGATRQAFLKYCINNSIIPLLFFVFYTISCVHFQRREEGTGWGEIVLLQAGFYIGFLSMIFVSFAYFFRVGRDLLKSVLGKITNPTLLREIIPYDALDSEFDMIQADTFLTETFRIEHLDGLEKYHPRLLAIILRRHHRNAVTATAFALTLLLLLGAFMDQPILRIPAGAGFLILFAVTLGIVGAVKYFLKSWEVIGWFLFILSIAWLVKHKIVDFRSTAFGINYRSPANQVPVYDYENLKSIFTKQKFEEDKALGITHLEAWKARQPEAKPPLVLITVSGGGSRSAYWTLRALQYADSATGGKLFQRAALLSGASGGMIGAADWRSIQLRKIEGRIANSYDKKYQDDIGKDLLNAIVFSFAAVDFISPFNKVKLAHYAYSKDRGYAMEQELIHNTEGMLAGSLADFKTAEKNALIPQMVINATIANDGRKLMISSLPVAYLTQPSYALSDSLTPPIDAIDFASFFKNQDPYNLRLVSALRMNATFPFVLPVVKLPCVPEMNVMDAGLRDNFGAEIASRWLHVFRDWLEANTSEVIWLQIRDTKEYDVLPPSTQDNLGAMLGDPLFVIQNKWEPFQSYFQSYLKDYIPDIFKGKMRFINLTYVSQKPDKTAKLNFHLTQQEKDDLYAAIQDKRNRQMVDTLVARIR
ncbi:MAG: patatin-like phospholipase family protein [Chitinophagaceae bacterium]